MIFPTRKKVSKGKSVQAVADFCATQSAKGKIVLKDASNVQLTGGVMSAGGFVKKDDGVLQYLTAINGEQIMLKETGLNMGIRTFPQLSGCKKVAWAFDVNKNTMAVTGPSATYKIYSGNIQKISSVIFDSLAMCQSRAFGLLGRRLYLSAPTEITFQDETWIDLPTSCVALVSNGELYALGNEVYKIDVDADEINVKVAKICANVGQVVADTVCVYGNKIIFVANDKIMSLQHGSLKELANLTESAVCATVHGGLYYLCSKTDEQDTVTAYNPHSGKVVSMYHVVANNIYSNGANLFISDGTNGYELTNTPQGCFWASKPINFDGNFATKHLYRMVIQTSTDVDVTLNADTSRTYCVKGKDVPQSMLLVGHGKNITVELYSAGAMRVKYLSLTARPSEVSV